MSLITDSFRGVSIMLVHLLSEDDQPCLCAIILDNIMGIFQRKPVSFIISFNALCLQDGGILSGAGAGRGETV